jgi:hypothetical protein
MIACYKRFLPRRSLKGLATFFIIGTTIGSFLSNRVKSQFGTDPVPAMSTQIGLAHRAYHFSCFGSIALTLLLLANTSQEEILALLFTAVLGGTIEITQYAAGMAAVFEWWDMRDDLWAITSTLGLIKFAELMAKRRAV